MAYARQRQAQAVVDLLSLKYSAGQLPFSFDELEGHLDFEFRN